MKLRYAILAAITGGSRTSGGTCEATEVTACKLLHLSRCMDGATCRRTSGFFGIVFQSYIVFLAWKV